MNVIVMNSIALRDNRYESRLRASTVKMFAAKMATPFEMANGQLAMGAGSWELGVRNCDEMA